MKVYTSIVLSAIAMQVVLAGNVDSFGPLDSNSLDEGEVKAAGSAPYDNNGNEVPLKPTSADGKSSVAPPGTSSTPSGVEGVDSKTTPSTSGSPFTMLGDSLTRNVPQTTNADQASVPGTPANEGDKSMPCPPLPYSYPSNTPTKVDGNHSTSPTPGNGSTPPTPGNGSTPPTPGNGSTPPTLNPDSSVG
ncbi:unnamed protein product [Peronospora destructor]|uniref:Uncharacterized protein n=1 Tax=Peronospora destructor TaxID=86335 RepID=A0AAV0TSY0_9STRA|nr:unnamed protein product [Peronospora destructor]